MDVKEALLKRRSIRKYTEEAVSDDMINELMHAAMAAPSAANKTPWEFYAVTNEAVLEQLRKASPYAGMKAPLAIIVVGDEKRFLPNGNALYWVQDCSAATENILLRAVELGLGTVWCGIHPVAEREEAVRAAVGIPATQVPLNIIYVGHPAQEREPNDQYKEEYVHFVR